MLASYRIEQGKIQNTFCEVQVSEHCNLACRSCSHLSPIMPRRFVEPDTVLRDFATLASCYHVEMVKLLGGEPLLHPALLEVAAAVRTTGISDRVCVVTNGVLLPRMREEFWGAIDEIWISHYPGFQLTSDQQQTLRQLAKEHKVRLRWESCPTFRESYAALGTTDEALVKRIFSTCQVAHNWRCHTVVDGYFFKCPQSYYLPKRLSAPGADSWADGIKISSQPSFRQQLLAYLESSEPLLSCQRCLGTVGRRFRHEQIARRAWTEPQEHTTEELLDRPLLQREERLARYPTLRRLQTVLPHAGNRAKISA
jgi:organic radical activating enzyme